MSDEVQESGWQRWRPLIAMGSFLLVFLIGFRYWADWKADQPIVIEYRQYLDFLVQRSPQAAAYQQRYFKAQVRETVASRHFEHVCAVMTGLAALDGFTLQEYPAYPALWCQEKSAFYNDVLLPP